MILTKKEFSNRFGFEHQSSVSKLISKGDIVVDNDGKIDLDERKNKSWAKKRDKYLKSEKEKQEKAEQLKLQLEQKKNDVEYEIKNQQLNSHLTKNKLLDLKLAKESGTVVETALLSKVIETTFDTLFKRLLNLPSQVSKELINIVLKDEGTAKENVTTFLTNRIKSELEQALKMSEQRAKKLYG